MLPVQSGNVFSHQLQMVATGSNCVGCVQLHQGRESRYRVHLPSKQLANPWSGSTAGSAGATAASIG